jgi:hypothetical protein
MTHTVSARRLLAVAALALAMPIAAACGSSTPPPTTDSRPAASSSVASSSAASTTSSETTPAAGDEAYCDALKDGQKELESISSNITDQAALKQGLAVLQKIRDSAPAEVEQAWGDFIAFVEAAAAGNTSALVGAMEKMQAAGTTIEAHAKATCNLDMS